MVIAVLNVGVSSANNKMPTIDFSTPEQPPGDTRRKVSGFMNSGSVAAAWRWHRVEIVLFASAALSSQLDL